MAKVLILAPKFDTATALWYPWLIHEYPKPFEDHNVEVIVLRKEEDVKDKVHETILEHEVDAILGVGHGHYAIFTGQKMEVIFRACAYDKKLVKDRNFAPVSCYVGRELLPDMVKKGLACGLGEVTTYSFAAIGGDPLKDPILALFTKSELQYWKSLLAGKTHREAWFEMKQAYYAAADSCKYPHVAALLRKDADNRKKFGDDNWRLVEAPPGPPSPPQPTGRYIIKIPERIEEVEVNLSYAGRPIRGKATIKKPELEIIVEPEEK